MRGALFPHSIDHWRFRPHFPLLALLSCLLLPGLIWSQFPGPGPGGPIPLPFSGFMPPRPGSTPPAPFAGEALAEPPAQQKPWDPPAGVDTLPAEFVNAAHVLFEQGLADPRECDYHAVEVNVPLGFATPFDNVIRRVNAWVIPGEGQRFAVSWNGCVYPIHSMGAAADWHKDAMPRSLEFPEDPLTQAHPEDASITFSSAGIRGCLALRLGDVALAREIWKTEQKSLTFGQPISADPYLRWAQRWTSDLYERAVGCYRRKEDRLSLLTLHQLDKLIPLVEQTAKQRHLAPPDRLDETTHTLVPGRYLPFLEPVPALLADQERRANRDVIFARQVRSSQLLSTLPLEERIEAHLDALEEVIGPPSLSPSARLPMDKDPHVAALIQEGEPAIVPLLHALETDAGSRLTRCITTTSPTDPIHTIHPIAEPIHDVLLTLMHTTDAAAGLEPKRPANAAACIEEGLRLHAWWDHTHTLDPMERWRAVLLDDKASLQAWCDALDHITAKDAQGRMAGESLRTSSKNPTLTHVLADRAQELMIKTEKWLGYSTELADPILYLEKAVAWDPPALRPFADQLARFIYDTIAKRPQLDWAYAGDLTARLLYVRVAAGDDTATQEWADWISERPPRHAAPNAITPLWRLPNDPHIRTLSQTLFQDSNSPWSLEVTRYIQNYRLLIGVESDPLLANESIRQLWRAGLDDTTTVVGRFEVTDDSTANIYLLQPPVDDDHPAKLPTSPNGPWIDLDARGLAGAKDELLMCDLAAMRCTAIHGFPKFFPGWSRTRKGLAIEQIKTALIKFGPLLRGVMPSPNWSDKQEVRIEYPRLDHPATAEDVAQGRAIFTLAPETSEVAPLTHFPLKGYRQSDINDNVLIWQAETRKMSGFSYLYYGIVSRHAVEKVPAREIGILEDK